MGLVTTIPFSESDTLLDRFKKVRDLGYTGLTIRERKYYWSVRSRPEIFVSSDFQGLDNTDEVTEFLKEHYPEVFL